MVKREVKNWLLAGVLLWMGLGLYLMQADLKLTSKVGSLSGMPAAVQHQALFGADWPAYQDMAAKLPAEAKILALVPDLYYFYKMNYFLYPRQITIAGDPNKLEEKLKRVNYDYVYVFYPQDNKGWGLTRVKGLWDRYQWTPEAVYRGMAAALGQETVGSREEWEERLGQGMGNLLVAVKEAE